MMRKVILVLVVLVTWSCEAWAPTKRRRIFIGTSLRRPSPCSESTIDVDPVAVEVTEGGTCAQPSRRAILGAWFSAPVISGSLAMPAFAASDTSSAEVTDKIFIEVKGLPGTAASADPTKRIVIGLFGKEAPSCVAKLKKLVSGGLPAPCRPRAERTLQKEQLEANKVYNSCKESEDLGVNLQYSTIWRIIKDERIDMGAVSGRFVAREFTEWNEDNAAGEPKLKHDAPGVVSVRRGSDSGFGFTVYPGDGTENSDQLNRDHIVVGRVLDGMAVVRELNEIPVISSAKVNYMALTGGPKTSTAPDRSCRYGGPMYCNENKPLVKLSITQTGVL